MLLPVLFVAAVVTASPANCLDDPDDFELSDQSATHCGAFSVHLLQTAARTSSRSVASRQKDSISDHDDIVNQLFPMQFPGEVRRQRNVPISSSFASSHASAPILSVFDAGQAGHGVMPDGAARHPCSKGSHGVDTANSTKTVAGHANHNGSVQTKTWASEFSFLALDVSVWVSIAAQQRVPLHRREGTVSAWAFFVVALVLIVLVATLILVENIGSATDHRPRLHGPGRPCTESLSNLMPSPRTIQTGLGHPGLAMRPPSGFLPLRPSSTYSARPYSSNLNHRAPLRMPGSGAAYEPGSWTGNASGWAPAQESFLTFAGAPSRLSLGAQPCDRTRPEPLCPALVNAHSEAWFATPMDRLVDSAGGSFDILGLSGTALLRGTKIIRASGVRSISISMPSANGPALASVDAAGSVGSETLIVRSAGGNIYGELLSSGPGKHVLMVGDAEALAVIVDVQSSRIRMYIPGTVSHIASAFRGTEGDFFQNAEHLEVSVDPGVDAVLALCCALGVTLLSGSRPASPRR